MNKLGFTVINKRPGLKPHIGLTGIVWLVLLLNLIWASLIIPASVIAAPAVPDPGPDFYVLDQAGVMSDQTRSMIIATSRELNQKTKAQVAVVTLKTLDGQPIEDVSLAIARKWQIGDKQLNNGVLILLVPSKTPGNRSRVEVGYGLEGALPDAKTGRIQDQYMVPAFNQGNYDQGLKDGYLAVVGQVAGEYGVSLIPVQGQPVSQTVPDEQKVPAWMAILGVLVLLFLFWLDFRFFNGFITGMLLGMLFRGGRGGGGGFGGGSSGGGGGFGGGGSSR